MKDLKKQLKLERLILEDKVASYLILKSMHIPTDHAQGALK